MELFGESRGKKREILSLLFQHDRDPRHGAQVAFNAISIFNSTNKIHKIPKKYLKYLEWGALLHDIGLSVDIRKHHKHSYDIIMKEKFKIITQQEKKIIAAIARYHRKSIPKSTHKAYKDLDSKDKKIVIQLAAILRIADGLDRSHSQSVKEIHAKIDDPHYLILELKGPYMVDMDVNGAYRKCGLFEMVFGRRVEIIRV